jgi:hypothetical protein
MVLGEAKHAPPVCVAALSADYVAPTNTFIRRFANT